MLNPSPQNLPDMSLRRLSSDDAAELAQAHALSFAGASAWSAAAFSSLLRQNTVLGLANDTPTRLACFALFQGIAPEAELLTLCTRPGHRRLGFAASLLRSAEIDLAACGIYRILLDVSEANKGAISLYESLGFVCISTREAYYPTPSGNQNALIMAKDFAGQAEVKGPSTPYGPS